MPGWTQDEAVSESCVNHELSSRRPVPGHLMFPFLEGVVGCVRFLLHFLLEFPLVAMWCSAVYAATRPKSRNSRMQEEYVHAPLPSYRSYGLSVRLTLGTSVNRSKP